MNLRNIVLDYSEVYQFVTTTVILVSSETCNLRQALAKEPLSAYWACSAEAAKAAFFCDLHGRDWRLHLARTFHKSWRLRIRPLDIYGPRIFRLLPLMKTWTRCLEIFLDLWNLDFVAASIMALKIWMVVARRAIYVAFGCWTTTDVELLRCVWMFDAKGHWPAFFYVEGKEE